MSKCLTRSTVRHTLPADTFGKRRGPDERKGAHHRRIPWYRPRTGRGVRRRRRNPCLGSAGRARPGRSRGADRRSSARSRSQRSRCRRCVVASRRGGCRSSPGPGQQRGCCCSRELRRCRPVVRGADDAGEPAGSMRLCREAVGTMQRRGGGHIVDISSLAGGAPVPGLVAYSASKAALSHLTRVLAVELAGLLIGTTLVELGPLSTPSRLARPSQRTSLGCGKGGAIPTGASDVQVCCALKTSGRSAGARPRTCGPVPTR